MTCQFLGHTNGIELGFRPQSILENIRPYPGMCLIPKLFEFCFYAVKFDMKGNIFLPQ